MLKDIWGSVTERFKSPFLVSFIISWLIWNWKIIIAIVFYDKNSVKTLLYEENYINFIVCNTDFNHAILFPVTSALVYLLFNSFFPVFYSNVADYIRVRIDKWGQTHIEKHAKGTKIPYQLYIEQKKQSSDVIDNLSNKIQEYDNKSAELIKEKEKIIAEKVKAIKDLQDLQFVMKHSFLDGKWNIEKKGIIDPVIIDSGVLYSGENKGSRIGIITDYAANPSEKKIYLRMSIFGDYFKSQFSELNSLEIYTYSFTLVDINGKKRPSLLLDSQSLAIYRTDMDSGENEIL